MDLKMAQMISVAKNKISDALCQTEYSIYINEIVKDLNIKLNMSYSSNVKIKCRHMTTSTEEGLESFRKNGLLDLKRMLQLNTPLSKFLAKYEILVDADYLSSSG